MRSEPGDPSSQPLPMANPNKPIPVADAVYALQSHLLDAVATAPQLRAAGTLLCRSDYDDVVTERSIAGSCGYPLCPKQLPGDRKTRKGRYKISLKEHRVYDLEETYMYCSSRCVVESRTFREGLEADRCLTAERSRIDEVMRMFQRDEGGGVDGVEDALARLTVRENNCAVPGEAGVEVDWRFNAIEGYVPKSDQQSNNRGKREAKPKNSKPSKKDFVIDDMNFTSIIITEDEYSVSKFPTKSGESSSRPVSKGLGQVAHEITQSHDTLLPKPSAESHMTDGNNLEELKGKSSVVFIEDKHHPGSLPSTSNDEAVGCSLQSNEMKGECVGSSDNEIFKPSSSSKVSKILKSSLKSTDAKRLHRSVTWADEKHGNGNLHRIKELEENGEHPVPLEIDHVQDDEHLMWLSSAGACAVALSRAAEAVASGDYEAADAASEAGLIVLPRPPDLNGSVDQDEGDLEEDLDDLESERPSVKWPRKPGDPNYDLFDSEDSWFDAPPDGFSLSLSPFATMWGALFAWVTSSSLAYIYGQEESSHEEYVQVKNREYPGKAVLPDGRSSEIKQTIGGCLARALPELVSELRLPVPIYILEQGLGQLLETMSFLDPLPAFRIKQWQVVLLLFMDALSVSRIPALTSHMAHKQPLLQKVLLGSQVSAEEYEIMKDLLIPLGRAPHLAALSGA
ncbi:hypothetical protein MLD38_028763 [Melastoma candidum]|uniref:Uncharacterized protein n=1 Tax=Melastoma candidum TaxID=119954 RepID=A0ACB9N1R0_9MYRT|nr:hypothetical protein MLD38_028763 [Melastoma candidum]